MISWDRKERIIQIMEFYEEYLQQDNSESVDYSEHIDNWVDEGHLDGGHSGHVDSYVDALS